MRDCGQRDQPYHDSQPCDDRCEGPGYWRIIWTWGQHQRGQIKVDSIEQAWQVAHEYLAKGYSIAFSLALAEHARRIAAVDGALAAVQESGLRL